MTTCTETSLAEVCRTGIPGYDPWGDTQGSWFDEESAAMAVAFFHEVLQHIEGALAGTPFYLGPWQQAIVGNIFGWKRNDKRGDVVRRYREAFIYAPRKSGKTPIMGGI